MKPKLYIFYFIALLALVVSCKTASKLYQKGNYEEAVELAAKKLQKDPGDPKLLEVLQQSYKYAVEDHESNIRTSSQSKNELKWEWIYNDYASLQRMYEVIRRSPGVYQIVKPTDYSSFLITYAQKAGDVRHDRGLGLMLKNDKQSYRQAYREFKTALVFKPGDRDVMEKMKEAYDQAVVNVVILPMNNRGFRYSNYQYRNGNFEESLIRSLRYNTGNEFVKFYSEWDARLNNIRADEIVDVRFSHINIGGYHDNRSTRQVSKDVVIKEIVYRPDSVVKEYGKVYADITTVRRTMRSEGLMQVNIRDGNGRFLWNDQYRSDHSWSTEFASYTGDTRALSDSDRQLINKQADNPPHEDEILRCLMEKIENDFLYRIRNYYNRF
jgi:hypothetical protein